MTIRLSDTSFAGTARTLVAVGTSSEASMFWTIRAAAPRIGLVTGPASFGSGAFSAAFAGAGFAGAGLGGADLAAVPPADPVEVAVGAGPGLGAGFGGAGLGAALLASVAGEGAAPFEEDVEPPARPSARSAVGTVPFSSVAGPLVLPTPVGL
ncbi:hypothetical protein GCM10020369_72310 [Cryptosporangium minutisporangium]|uniref:Uncharacterized protein n=1 Tax=Cryptosporangium minutisporangium TaxID=113569 RepID=A0ABP6T8U6_9ACTN